MRDVPAFVGHHPYYHDAQYFFFGLHKFLATIFASPSTCAYKNNLHKCTFTFTCWLVGGTSHGGCGEDYDWLYTCCVPSSTPITGGLAGKGPTGSKPNYKRTPIKKHDLYPVPPPPSCGVPAIQFRKRIIGGNEAYFGEFPWQAHIRIAGYQCGGVLVSQWFVVTAAHCIHRARLRDIKVFLGEYDTQNTGNYIEPLPEEIHKVSKKILHPHFQFKITQPDRFDIALLKLSRKVQYKENILPICLPEQSDTFEGYIGVVAGWGKTDTTYGNTLERLFFSRFVNVIIIIIIIIFLHKGKWTLAGITSAGFGCAVDHQPGIYHKVAFTSKWITTIINRGK
ncbi:trypsin-beta, putative [Pediculus humanus corporis]|uniref:Trypsin-beta, putative n=1 Tax=Pediculus humanus subsp. corporis TaxID=121224 RepID=E0W194_PEDHC|nr:trypsin-beta, putative [Pediculus humanus corporis]EEB19400.1 trypsin-beta, putative [Pediculus humanus corporis]